MTKIVKFLGLAMLLLLLSNTATAQLDWVPFKGEIPSNAVIGGQENNQALAVCRYEYQGAKHPGKVVGKNCNIGYGGAEKYSSTFEILINKGSVHLDWEKTTGALPADAIQGGAENGKPLYIGRAPYAEGMHPGKVFSVGKNHICNIGYGGKEITLNEFEVLVQHTDNGNFKALDHDQRCVGDKGIIAEATFIGAINKDKDRKIEQGQSLISRNLQYQCRVTTDGRLVVEKISEKALCKDGRILVFAATEIWANTTDKGDATKDYFFKFQEDGNLCVYSEQSGFVWCSKSNANDGHHLELTNIGHLEVVNSHGGEIWPD